MTDQFYVCERCCESVDKLIDGLCRPCEELRLDQEWSEDEVERPVEHDE